MLLPLDGGEGQTLRRRRSGPRLIPVSMSRRLRESQAVSDASSPSPEPWLPWRRAPPAASAAAASGTAAAALVANGHARARAPWPPSLVVDTSVAETAPLSPRLRPVGPLRKPRRDLPRLPPRTPSLSQATSIAAHRAARWPSPGSTEGGEEAAMGMDEARSEGEAEGAAATAAGGGAGVNATDDVHNPLLRPRAVEGGLAVLPLEIRAAWGWAAGLPLGRFVGMGRVRVGREVDLMRLPRLPVHAACFCSAPRPRRSRAATSRCWKRTRRCPTCTAGSCSATCTSTSCRPPSSARAWRRRA